MDKVNIQNTANTVKKSVKVMGVLAFIVGILSFFVLGGSLAFGGILMFCMLFGPPADAISKIKILTINKALICAAFSATAIFLGCKGIKGYKALSISGIILGVITLAINFAILAFRLLVSL